MLRLRREQPTGDEVYRALLGRPATAAELARVVRPLSMEGGSAMRRRRLVRAIARQLRSLRRDGRVTLNRVLAPSGQLEWRALGREAALVRQQTDAALARFRAALFEEAR